MPTRLLTSTGTTVLSAGIAADLNLDGTNTAPQLGAPVAVSGTVKNTGNTNPVTALTLSWSNDNGATWVADAALNTALAAALPLAAGSALDFTADPSARTNVKLNATSASGTTVVVVLNRAVA